MEPPHTLVGYARVSTREQHLDLQLDALKKQGCSKIFQDMVSGSKADRPGLKAALEYLRPGDKLVIWKLDRLGRSLQHLIETVKLLQARGVDLLVVQERMDTASPTGKLFFHMMGALAEFERDLIRERTLAGLEAARARGRKGGRRALLNPGQVEMARTLMKDPRNKVADVCQTLGISKTTLYRSLGKKHHE